MAKPRGTDAHPRRAAVHRHARSAGVPGGAPAGRAAARQCERDRRRSGSSFTPLAADHELAKRFAAFEKRVAATRRSPGLPPRLRQHARAGRRAADRRRRRSSQRSCSKARFDNFPDPNVEKDNVNYLAGVREIGVRSEYTDGRDMPRLLIRSVEFEGPLYDAWPPAPHRNIFIDTTGSRRPAYARKVIRDFATRAFRRPITAEEEKRARSAVYRESPSTAGRSFQDSVKDALQVVLTSPQFLFLIENSRRRTPSRSTTTSWRRSCRTSCGTARRTRTTLQLAASRRAAASSWTPKSARMIADPRFSPVHGRVRRRSGWPRQVRGARTGPQAVPQAHARHPHAAAAGAGASSSST